MTPLHHYLLGTASWFLSFGLQSVMFAWLVTMILQATPTRVGFAQMTMLLPATLLMLIGGSLADQYGGRRIALIAQVLAIAAPVFLIVQLNRESLGYSDMLVFAIYMGTMQAFITPARDGLINQIAQGRLQRRVIQASLTQFGMQMVGFLIASMADRTGATFILLIQCLSLGLGAFAFSQLRIDEPQHGAKGSFKIREMAASIIEGYRSVRVSPAMRMVVVQNCAMGICFMGSYIVTLPILVRDVYGGSATQLAWMNTANALGFVVSILMLLHLGDFQRHGRALLLGQLTGALALGSIGLGFGFTWLFFAIFAWGICGGVGMTLSRTIMQAHAPDDQRARMMAFYSLSFMGSGPIGAIFSGLLVDAFGPAISLIISATLMLTILLTLTTFSGLWQLTAKGEALAESG